MNKFFSFLIIFLFISNLFALTKFDQSSYINTKNITYDSTKNTIELGKDSLLNFGSTNVLTNNAIIDYDRNYIKTIGSFYFYQDEFILSGENLLSNLKFDDFSANNVSYIYNNDLKVDSQQLSRKNNKITFNNNFITPCELNGYFKCPTWSLKIKKTEYFVNQDKFIHYKSFLQIADKKLFYVPYFSHYGAKAGRKSGFLSPSFSFDLLNNDISVITPYYLPLSISDDITITPKLSIFPSNLEISKNFEINSLYAKKSKGGDINIKMITQKTNNESNLYNTIKFSSKQTINKNNKIEISSLYTNSISSARSKNEDQISFENAFIRLKSFNFAKDKDVLISELNTVTAFDNSNDSLIPYQIPFIKYINNYDLRNNSSLYNSVEFAYLKRETSNNLYASNGYHLNIENKYIQNNKYSNLYIQNKFIIINKFKNLKYIENTSNNSELMQINSSFSSELNYILSKYIKLRSKLISSNTIKTSKNYNEESHSYTFNYINNFEENRFFGSDFIDKSNRIAYGIELNQAIEDIKINFKIGQMYDLKKNNSYLSTIKQNDNFSDIALNTGLDFKDLVMLKLDSRLEKKNLSKKEMNYSIKLLKPINAELNYIETSSEAFKENSDDSKSLKLTLAKNINENFKVSGFTNLDLKNNYNPFQNNVSLTFFDECSELQLNYNNSKFSDNFNMVPTETISMTFRMDYLGYFGYEQKTNLFIDENNN